MVGGEDRDQKEAKDEFGEFLPEERSFIADRFGLALTGPIDGIRENDESDHGVAGGFDKHGKLGGSVGIESACCGGFGSIVHREAGPDTVGLIGEMEGVAD